MSKKAFCVGINDYPYDGSDLKGCVNDANGWAKLLVAHFDFPRGDVKLITNSEATKRAIVSGLKELLTGARSGDVLVFTNSSHGSYKADTSGDEPRYDEVLCPYDCKDNLLVDDELRELFTDLPAGAALTVISDSCHSGTVTRAAVDENVPGLFTPDERRVRFLNPALRGDPVIPNPWKAKPTRWEKYPEAKMKEILLSGCTDKEYSYDALIAKDYHGAMTYYALKAIRGADNRITYGKLLERLHEDLDEAGYPQHPQLEGSNVRTDRQIFT